MVNVHSAASTAPFSGAAEAKPQHVEIRHAEPKPTQPKRVENSTSSGTRVEIRHAKAPSVKNTPKDAAPSKGNVEVQVSPQSRQAAQPPDMASENAFAAAGMQQHTVFAEYLAQQGPEAGMSAEQIAGTQSLLRDVTGAMDAIAPANPNAISETAPSQTAAELALVSSREALEEIASQLPEQMQEDFRALIGGYKEHNEIVVANHRNIYDYRDTSIATAGDPVPAYAEGKVRMEGSEIMRKLGNIAHPEEEKEEILKTYTSLFDNARRSGTDASALLQKVENAYVNYASGGSQDKAVRSTIMERNQDTLEQMLSYWNKLLPQNP